MKFKACLIMLFTTVFWPFMAFAAACDVPHFESFQPTSVPQTNPDLVAVEFAMQPVATLRIPSGFVKWGAFPYGSVGFGEHPHGIVGVLGYETRESVSVHKEGATPADFMLSIFRGLDETGCEYMKGQGLPDEDYRLHATLDGGAELFAYGKVSTHHFYVIRPDKPDYVLNGLFKNISRADFEVILSTIRSQ